MKQSGKFTLRIDQDNIDILKQEAAKEGLTLSAFIRRMLRAHLNKTKLLNQGSLQAVVTTNMPERAGGGYQGEETSRECQSEGTTHVVFTD